ncbi:MAG: ABC transporter permease [Proteobacteria bacterium]|nr:ABC transporter permease [Pseudomonadota bacterium]
MGKCLLVAGRELRAYFSTWMGYVICAAALFIEGLLFNAYAVGNQPKVSADVLADYFYFASGMTMVAGVFLAMRLLAEEKQNGTLVLFYTSPISERQIVYGKFLSALCFSLIIQLLSLYMPGLVFMVGKVSLGHLAAGYLMLTLLGACAISISLFASAISPNQLVAGVTGALFLVTFLILWMVADVVSPPLKELFGYLAIHNRHFVPFAQGIVHTRDVIYYGSVVVFFLECSVRALEARRWQG